MSVKTNQVLLVITFLAVVVEWLAKKMLTPRPSWLTAVSLATSVAFIFLAVKLLSAYDKSK